MSVMSPVGLTLAILWIFSLWLLLVEQHRLRRRVLSRSLTALGLVSGVLLFFILSLSGLLLLRLLIAD